MNQFYELMLSDIRFSTVNNLLFINIILWLLHISCYLFLGANQTRLSQLEMVTLLCMGDKTHSQLMELMPERCGTVQSKDFEAALAEVGYKKTLKR